MNAKQAKYPQLRFKGFTDPWVQSKLGEVGKTQSGIGFPDGSSLKCWCKLNSANLSFHKLKHTGFF